MKVSMEEYNGLEGQKKRKLKLQTPNPNTMTPTEVPSSISTDHPEPECEVHSNEDPGDKPSLQNMRQHPSVPGMRISSNDPPEDWFEEECNDTATCEGHKSSASLENKKERKSILRDLTNLNADSIEWKAKKPEGASTSNNIALDDYSSEIEFENEMFSATFLHEAAETGDDLSFCLDLEGTDSEIQVAVNEIRKEAEKIDTILVLDQFKTLQTEFDSITRKCSLKTIENEDLKMQLQESENRVAHMELELDLHHADAERLREDLKTVVSKLFDISMYESSELIDENLSRIKETTDACESENRLGFVHTPVNTSQNEISSMGIIVRNRNIQEDRRNMTSFGREKIRIIGLVDQPRHAIYRSSLLSNSGLVHRKPRGKWDHSSEEDTACLLPSSPEIQPLRNQNVFRKRSNHVGRYLQKDSARAEWQSMVGIRSDNTEKDFQITFLRNQKTLSAVDTHSTSLVTETNDEEAEKEKRRCGMLFRRRDKQRSFSKEDVSVLKQQIHQLNETMKTSLATSEKLRKRLKVISRYYGGIIAKFQTRIDEAKKGKARAQNDLLNWAHQVDHERRLEQSKFEYELRRKDREIERLKAGIDQGEV